MRTEYIHEMYNVTVLSVKTFGSIFFNITWKRVKISEYWKMCRF